MENVARIMEAANSVGAIIALLLVGIFLLLWRYGGQLLKRLEKNTVLTQQAHDVATEANDTANDIANSIITNHGSKNLGDAIDRLTEWVSVVRAGQELNAEQWKSVHYQLSLVDTRLSALEARPAPAAVVTVQGSSADVQSDC